MVTLVAFDSFFEPKQIVSLSSCYYLTTGYSNASSNLYKKNAATADFASKSACGFNIEIRSRK